MAPATKLLILHVPAGGGHKAVARAIGEAAAACGADVARWIAGRAPTSTRLDKAA